MKTETKGIHITFCVKAQTLEKVDTHNVFIAVFLHTQKCVAHTHTHTHTHTQSGEVSLSEPWFVTTGATADLSP